MRLCFLLFFLSLVICRCESETFDKDKRQIAAKNAVLDRLRFARNFDVTGFREDTLSSSTDSVFKRPIRYTLDFVFTDSTGTEQKRNAEVLFTPDGKSLMTTRINQPNQ